MNVVFEIHPIQTSLGKIAQRAVFLFVVFFYGHEAYAQNWLDNYQQASEFEKRASIKPDSSGFYYCLAATFYYEALVDLTAVGAQNSGREYSTLPTESPGDSLLYYYGALWGHVRTLDSLPAKSCVSRKQWAALALDSSYDYQSLNAGHVILDFRLRCAEKAYSLGWHKPDWLIAIAALAHRSVRRDDETVWFHRIDMDYNHFNRKEKRELEEFYQRIGRK